jgi:hypothetical protein
MYLSQYLSQEYLVLCACILLLSAYVYGFHYIYLQVNATVEVIYDLVDPTANLIFGEVLDPSFNGQVS